MIPILDLKAQYEPIKLETASRLPRCDRVVCFSTSEVLARQRVFLSRVCLDKYREDSYNIIAD
jgi:hypothetical protein